MYENFSLSHTHTHPSLVSCLSPKHPSFVCFFFFFKFKHRSTRKHAQLIKIIIIFFLFLQNPNTCTTPDPRVNKKLTRVIIIFLFFNNEIQTQIHIHNPFWDLLGNFENLHSQWGGVLCGIVFRTIEDKMLMSFFFPQHFIRYAD